MTGPEARARPRRPVAVVPPALVVVLVVALVEAVVVWSYLVRGVTWHLLLHTPLGVGLGLAAGAATGALRRRPTSPWRWGLAGQLVSVAPDLLFVLARIPHLMWMDVFVGHVTVHLVDAPLLVSGAVLVAGAGAWLLADAGARLRGGLAAALTALVLLVPLLAAPPVPDTLAGQRARAPAVPEGTTPGPASAAPVVDGLGAPLDVADPSLWCGDPGTGSPG